MSPVLGNTTPQNASISGPKTETQSVNEEESKEKLVKTEIEHKEGAAISQSESEQQLIVPLITQEEKVMTDQPVEVTVSVKISTNEIPQNQTNIEVESSKGPSE